MGKWVKNGYTGMQNDHKLMQNEHRRRQNYHKLMTHSFVHTSPTCVKIQQACCAELRLLRVQPDSLAHGRLSQVAKKID